MRSMSKSPGVCSSTTVHTSTKNKVWPTLPAGQRHLFGKEWTDPCCIGQRHCNSHMINTDVTWLTQMSHDQHRCHMINTDVTWSTQMSYSCMHHTNCQVHRSGCLSDKYIQCGSTLLQVFWKDASHSDKLSSKELQCLGLCMQCTTMVESTSSDLKNYWDDKVFKNWIKHFLLQPAYNTWASLCAWQYQCKYILQNIIVEKRSTKNLHSFTNKYYCLVRQTTSNCELYSKDVWWFR